jgi:hypothetical protein
MFVICSIIFIHVEKGKGRKWKKVDEKAGGKRQGEKAVGKLVRKWVEKGSEKRQ